ncbi:MAG TPA: hypothetical protein VFL99_13940 [Segeticoccus sp.]|uniref:hypothetical protein n=1 Tax=Segeticoccus sp. TaxID=2706531 RepID=UPI002D80361E|nr:hypothetical protein [Segeticoccus sp.]HET8601425.1 hypothetical protein [Segeticoccus sp.]
MPSSAGPPVDSATAAEQVARIRNRLLEGRGPGAGEQEVAHHTYARPVPGQPAQTPRAGHHLLAVAVAGACGVALGDLFARRRAARHPARHPGRRAARPGRAAHRRGA